MKVLRGAAARDGGEIARLRREAHIQADVEHPNIARVMDLDQMPDGSMYVVMERLVGRSLADKLAREHLVAPGFAIPVFIGVCRALGAAHKKGVVHRDSKPGNMFLCEDGTPKVLDFGMSKLTTRGVAHAGGLHARHAGVHGARAVHRRGGRAAHGHLRARRPHVRSAHRRAADLVAEPPRAARSASAPGPEADAPAQAGSAISRRRSTRRDEVPEARRSAIAPGARSRSKRRSRAIPRGNALTRYPPRSARSRCAAAAAADETRRRSRKVGERAAAARAERRRDGRARVASRARLAGADAVYRAWQRTRVARRSLASQMMRDGGARDDERSHRRRRARPSARSRRRFCWVAGLSIDAIGAATPAECGSRTARPASALDACVFAAAAGRLLCRRQRLVGAGLELRERVARRARRARARSLPTTHHRGRAPRARRVRAGCADSAKNTPFRRAEVARSSTVAPRRMTCACSRDSVGIREQADRTSRRGRRRRARPSSCEREPAPTSGPSTTRTARPRVVAHRVHRLRHEREREVARGEREVGRGGEL